MKGVGHLSKIQNSGAFIFVETTKGISKALFSKIFTTNNIKSQKVAPYNPVDDRMCTDCAPLKINLLLTASSEAKQPQRDLYTTPMWTCICIAG